MKIDDSQLLNIVKLGYTLQNLVAAVGGILVVFLYHESNSLDYLNFLAKFSGLKKTAYNKQL